jgi:predicted kinase
MTAMKQTLFLMVGYPGAGKTTVARLIHEQTGAVHLWADLERRRMFASPSHSAEESRALYEYLNKTTERLLSEGKSVIFDTNFNFYKDREHLRHIADTYGAQTVVLWITTAKTIAKQRAVHDKNLRNGYELLLDEADFERLSNHLEPPKQNEHVIELVGSNVTKDSIKQLLENI